MSAPDTADLRSGAPLHDALLALLPLVGAWVGTGVGVAPDGDQFAFGQQLRFVHDGRPFLAYEARSWLLDPDGGVIRQAWRESGFWRPGDGPDGIDVVLASNTGAALLYAGTAGDQRWLIQTTSSAHAPSAKTIDAERRMYALTGETLAYVTELAPAGRPYAPHLNATLLRN